MNFDDWVGAELKLFAGRRNTASETPPIRILKGPFGSRCSLAPLSAVTNAIKEADFDSSDGPLVILLPTLSEVDSAVALLRSNAVSPEVRQEPRIAPYKGKISAGCKIPEQMRAVQQTGRTGDSLCETQETSKEGAASIRRCEHYDVCPYIRQLDDLSEADVILAPTAVLTTRVPEALKRARGVVVFGGVSDTLLNVKRLPVQVLQKSSQGRRIPFLSRPEKIAGVDAVAIADERRKACELAVDAIMSGRDIANHIFSSYAPRDPLDFMSWSDIHSIIRSAKRCCGALSLTPERSEIRDYDVERVCEYSEGEHVVAEYMLWRHVEERLMELFNHRETEYSIVKLERYIIDEVTTENLVEFRSRLSKARERVSLLGSRDLRLNVMTPDRLGESGSQSYVSVSWVSRPNWDSIPVIIVDSFSDERLVSALYAGREAVTLSFEAKFSVVTTIVADGSYSKSTFLPAWTARKEVLVRSATSLSSVRRLIAAVAAMNPSGRILVACVKDVRDLINTAWSCPLNVDFYAYGTRDFPNPMIRHSSVITVGTLQLPYDTIEGFASALAHQDYLSGVSSSDVKKVANAEYQFNGATPCKSPRAIRMRDGSEVITSTQFFPDPFYWHQKIDLQSRERELSYALGSLKAAEEGSEAPTWISLGTLVPDGAIADEITTMADLMEPGSPYASPVWDGVRIAGDFDAERIFSAAGHLFSEPPHQGISECKPYLRESDEQYAMPCGSDLACTNDALSVEVGDRQMRADLERFFLTHMMSKVDNEARPATVFKGRPTWIEAARNSLDIYRSAQRERTSVSEKTIRVLRGGQAPFPEFGNLPYPSPLDW